MTARPNSSPPKPPPLPPVPLVESAGRDTFDIARRAVRRRVAVAAGVVAVIVVLLVGAYLMAAFKRVAGCRELANRYGQATGLDPALVLAVIRAESKGRARAVSRAGARGLMQLMPATAKALAEEEGIDYSGPDDLFDPVLNVRLGTLYLARLRRQFRDDPLLYVAAYNAGPGNVDKWQLQNPGLSSAEIIERVAFAETRTYVGRVMAAWGRGGRSRQSAGGSRQ